MTDDDKALVERLLQADRVVTLMEADENGHHLVTTGPHIQHEAADRIEALSAENERLREALLQMKRIPNYIRKDDNRKEMLKIINAALGETK